MEYQPYVHQYTGVLTGETREVMMYPCFKDQDGSVVYCASSEITEQQMLVMVQMGYTPLPILSSICIP